MNKKKNISLIITGIIIIILLCIGFTKKEFQNDTFYTIKVGESIIKNGIDMKDHFSWINLPYCYPHWLYDVGIYYIYHNFGFDGIYVSTIILYCILGIVIFGVNLKLCKSKIVSLLISIYTIIICGVFATARAQLVTYILFVLEVYFIERLLTSSKKRYGIYLLIICLLIANIHAAVWPFYFILYLPFITSHILAILKDKYFNNKKSNIFIDKLEFIKYDNIKYLLIIFIISLFIGLLTPIGDIPYTYSIKIMMGKSQEYIMEHFPLVLKENVFVISFLIIYLFILIFTKVKIRVSDFFLIFGLIIMSFMSVRHVSFLLSIGMISFCRIANDLCIIINKNKLLDIDAPIVFQIMIIIMMCTCSGFIYFKLNNKEYINTNNYPVSAVKYLKNNYDTDNIRLYNDYNFGSYILFNNIKVSVDSRSDLYLKEFNGEFDYFVENMLIDNVYDDVFKRYDITHILTMKTTTLSKILMVDSRYDLVFSDGNFSLFIRKNS